MCGKCGESSAVLTGSRAHAHDAGKVERRSLLHRGAPSVSRLQLLARDIVNPSLSTSNWSGGFALDRAKCRNANRVAGEPLPIRGSCLSLWKHATVRDELHRILTTPSYPRQYGVQLPPPRPVELSWLSPEQVDQLRDEAREARAASAAARVPARRDPVRDAWVAMLLPYFADTESCFFTGTYSDGYGFPHGLVSARNALRDWRRFLHAHELDRGIWVVAAEPHQERPIWHLHGLLKGLDAAARAEVAAAWQESRGWAQAAPLHDGGVAYATKYAVKCGDTVAFDWNLQ